ncbi:hypothetical protein HSEST_1440 [Halapricum desulfuricans]|uniref:Uncharacterized protein n=1 Tax=Halapricum desulfuricans TaxID=2841257 RepID=A0A897NWD2_9EURY|nr:hypothetical protein HSEST_1440 [Halapricum desulfuricans]
MATPEKSVRILRLTKNNWMMILLKIALNHWDTYDTGLAENNIEDLGSLIEGSIYSDFSFTKINI